MLLTTNTDRLELGLNICNSTGQFSSGQGCPGSGNQSSCHLPFEPRHNRSNRVGQSCTQGGRRPAKCTHRRPPPHSCSYKSISPTEHCWVTARGLGCTNMSYLRSNRVAARPTFSARVGGCCVVEGLISACPSVFLNREVAAHAFQRGRPVAWPAVVTQGTATHGWLRVKRVWRAAPPTHS